MKIKFKNTVQMHENGIDQKQDESNENWPEWKLVKMMIDWNKNISKRIWIETKIDQNEGRSKCRCVKMKKDEKRFYMSSCSILILIYPTLWHAQIENARRRIEPLLCYLLPLTSARSRLRHPMLAMQTKFHRIHICEGERRHSLYSTPCGPRDHLLP